MQKNDQAIRLRLVNTSDYRFLYKNLKGRKLVTNISHKTVPSYKDHVKFVNSKPYSKWYIVEQSKGKIGSVYLTKENEIAIHLKNGQFSTNIYQNIFEQIKEKHPNHRKFVNINPKNSKLIDFFKKNGFTLRQVTYAIDYDSEIF